LRLLVDVIFCVLDASRLACPSVNTDQMFRKKLEKNKNRPGLRFFAEGR
jgi:hypothetical protein